MRSSKRRAIAKFIEGMCKAWAPEGPYGVEDDERAGQPQPFEQQRNGNDFVGLLVDRLCARTKR